MNKSTFPQHEKRMEPSILFYFINLIRMGEHEFHTNSVTTIPRRSLKLRKTPAWDPFFTKKELQRGCRFENFDNQSSGGIL